MDDPIRCFMDGIDYQHHLGYDRQGTKLYASKEALIEGTGHDLAECGIVEVEVRLVGWLVPQDLPRPESSPKEAKPDG